MKKLTIEINIRNFIIGAAASAVLICFGSIGTQAQATCLTAQAIMAQKDTITQAEVLKQRDCWVAKLKNQGNRDMNFAGAFLMGADLSASNITMPVDKYKNLDLNDANLSRADLSGANLMDAILNRADLSGADLRGADLRGAKLNGAILISANLSGSKLYIANLTNAYLRGADLTDCGFFTYDEGFAKVRSNYSDEEWRRIPGADLTNIKKDIATRTEVGLSVNLKGAKISSATKGTSVTYWTANGGVVAD
ncbi:MAG: pentapeptide repeat-containing protein [Acidobacteria bacterium]|nr:pentapeptide repeat-containing protein [Acidobacteriota bacterium]